MKRNLRFFAAAVALLLSAACSLGSVAATVPDSQTNEIAVVEGTDAVAVGTDAGAESTPLADPVDETKVSTDDFSLSGESGEILPDGSVYTITEAGEYTLSGALSDGQSVVNVGDQI